MMKNILEKKYRLELEILEERFKQIGYAKTHPNEFGALSQPGTYALVVYVDNPFSLRNWVFREGIYVYVGSSKKGLKYRLLRHAGNHKKLRWHVDYLLLRSFVLWAYHGNLEETFLANFLNKHYIALKGFGNSDDPTSKSHLFYVFPFSHVISLMRKEGKKRNAPVYEALDKTKDAFERFIFVFLSSRTRDEVTLKVTKRLIKEYSSWEEIRDADPEDIEQLIRGVAFHKVKTRNLKKISLILKNREVPNTYEQLVALPGVGDKIANVFLADVFNKNTIGVDTHVHRISNRLGVVSTKTPLQTKKILDRLVPERLKSTYNISCVGFGQTICTYSKPLCASCPISTFCQSFVAKHTSNNDKEV